MIQGWLNVCNTNGSRHHLRYASWLALCEVDADLIVRPWWIFDWHCIFLPVHVIHNLLESLINPLHHLRAELSGSARWLNSVNKHKLIFEITMYHNQSCGIKTVLAFSFLYISLRQKFKTWLLTNIELSMCVCKLTMTIFVSLILLSIC